MSEFIGSRISLISKSDIKYVGTLHEINSETSTVALENVRSFGTEGRRGNPDDEIGPNDQIYDYIVFRGSDVKDLTIVEPPKENKAPQPPPNDPAILGAARPQGQPQAAPPASAPQHPQQSFQPPPQGQQWRGPPPPHFPPYGYPPPPQQAAQFANPAGPHGFPQGPGGPPGYGMQYGAPPPGWYGPGQGFPAGPPGPFPAGPQPIGPPGLQNQQKTPAPATQSKTQEDEPARQSDNKTAASAELPAAGPPPPNESKPDASVATAPSQQQSQSKAAAPAQKSNRVAVPLTTPNARAQAPQAAPLQSKPGNTQPPVAQQSATQAAAAAVAAAMAKLGPVQGSRTDAGVDNLAKKVGEMRTDDRNRHGRQPGPAGYATGNRGGRGGRRPSTQQTKPVEVPTTDFDFEASNAKFDKQDLVKEAIASGDPLAPNGEHESKPAINESTDNHAANGNDDVEIPKTTYNKTTSFFDNISSELKDRRAAQEDGKRPGGTEFRFEERKKNFETFGQGSVDNGFRGGFRGRGRGRGFGRGRGGFSEGRGGYGRGGRGGGGGVDSQNSTTFA